MRMIPEDYIFYQGEKFQVEFYFTETGELPAKKYFDDADRLVQIKLLTLVKYIAENGKLFDENKFRIVDRQEKIYEFKPMAERFFNFFAEGKRIVITNAYRKKTDKADAKEVRRVIAFRKNYNCRMKQGVYYAADEDQDIC